MGKISVGISKPQGIVGGDIIREITAIKDEAVAASEAAQGSATEAAASEAGAREAQSNAASSAEEARSAASTAANDALSNLGLVVIDGKLNVIYEEQE